MVEWAEQMGAELMKGLIKLIRLLLLLLRLDWRMWAAVVQGWLGRDYWGMFIIFLRLNGRV